SSRCFFDQNASADGEPYPGEGDRRAKRDSTTNAGDSERDSESARYCCAGAVASNFHAAKERRSSRPIDSSGGAGAYQHNHARDGRCWTSCVALPFHTVPRQYGLRLLSGNWAAVYRSSKCGVVGSVGWSAEIHSLRRSMGRCSVACVTLVCDLEQ